MRNFLQKIKCFVGCHKFVWLYKHEEWSPHHCVRVHKVCVRCDREVFGWVDKKDGAIFGWSDDDSIWDIKPKDLR